MIWKIWVVFGHIFYDPRISRIREKSPENCPKFFDLYTLRLNFWVFHLIDWGESYSYLSDQGSISSTCFRAAFTCAGPKKQKAAKLDCLFGVFGFELVKWWWNWPLSCYKLDRLFSCFFGKPRSEGHLDHVWPQKACSLSCPFYYYPFDPHLSFTDLMQLWVCVKCGFQT